MLTSFWHPPGIVLEFLSSPPKHIQNDFHSTFIFEAIRRFIAQIGTIPVSREPHPHRVDGPTLQGASLLIDARILKRAESAHWTRALR